MKNKINKMIICKLVKKKIIKNMLAINYSMMKKQINGLNINHL